MCRKVIFSILFAAAITNLVFSDILPENKKKISFSFEVINIDSFGDYIFLAYPVNISDGAIFIVCLTISSGEPIYLPCKYDLPPRIYAIKKDFYNPDDYKYGIDRKKLDSLFANNKNHIPSIRISCSGLADKNASYNTVLDSYKIESITADTMIIILDKTVKKDKNGNIIDEFKGDVVGIPGGKSFTNYIYYAIPFAAIILIVTIVVIRKMKK